MQPDIWFINLGIKIYELNKVAFKIGNVNIYWYGILLGLGAAAGLSVAMREAKKTGQNTDVYLDLFLFGLVFSIVFARLYYVAFTWDKFKDNLLKIFSIREGGIAIYGSIIGAVIAAFIFSKYKKINFFKLTDTCAFGLLVGQIIGRWGNFVNREAFGGYTDSLFAMRCLKSDVVTANLNINYLDSITAPDNPSYIQVHPTFLYESLWNIGVFILLNILKKHKKFDGEITGLYFIFYGIGRFWIEGLRTDQLRLGHTDIAVSQLVSIIMIAVSIVFIFLNRKKAVNQYKKA